MFKPPPHEIPDRPEYWGKARPEVTAAATGHPAACHCLDVAAVAEALLR
jgi:hypothetical protein